MKCSVSVMTSDWGDSLDSSGHLTKLLLSRDSLWRVRLSSGLAVSFKVFIWRFSVTVDCLLTWFSRMVLTVFWMLLSSSCNLSYFRVSEYFDQLIGYYKIRNYTITKHRIVDNSGHLGRIPSLWNAKHLQVMKLQELSNGSRLSQDTVRSWLKYRDVVCHI